MKLFHYYSNPKHTVPLYCSKHCYKVHKTVLDTNIHHTSKHVAFQPFYHTSKKEKKRMEYDINNLLLFLLVVVWCGVMV
jgi:hypothetical protein